VPEAAVNEDGDLLTREDRVYLTAQAPKWASVLAKAQAEAVKR
jgi:hypothetical protein